MTKTGFAELFWMFFPNHTLLQALCCACVLVYLLIPSAGVASLGCCIIHLAALLPGGRVM